jgi:hypothetical protein
MWMTEEKGYNNGMKVAENIPFNFQMIERTVCKMHGVKMENRTLIMKERSQIRFAKIQLVLHTQRSKLKDKSKMK